MSARVCWVRQGLDNQRQVREDGHEGKRDMLSSESASC